MSLLKFLNICREQLFFKLPYPETPITGQVIIVTGSNTGLGLEAARHYVRLGAAKVILAVRSLEKGEAAKTSLEESENRLGVVEVWHLDLSNYDSIKQFSKRANALPRLDILLENAGIATREYRITEEDESTITTNVIGTFLLALLLLPKLRESAREYGTRPRLTVVASEVHFFTQFPEKDSEDIFGALSGRDTARMDERYETSKLLQIFYLRALAAHTSHPTTNNNHNNTIMLNIVNPGLCHSEFNREGRLDLAVMKFFLARTTEVGSRNLVYATTAGEETHGLYISSCRVDSVAPLVTSDIGTETQKRVWEQLNMKLEKIEP
ncbi:MAG: hypothetical protein Q9198_003824, partial [Flavoplaca austrocitrina]